MAEYIEREAAVMRLIQDGCSAKNVQSIMELPAVSVPQWISVMDAISRRVCRRYSVLLCLRNRFC